MIKYFLIIAIALLNTGCSTINLPTSSKSQLSENTPQVVDIEEAQIFEQCMIQNQTIDPESFEDVWQRVTHQLSIEIPDNRRVRAQKSWYVNHPEYLRRVSKRSSPYLYFIVEELEKRQLPLELALLPIVESAYDPFAYSHGRASGMWQFIPGTGKGYGLAQNWWYDGRRDVFLSTHAALDYLSYLNKRFDGDWLHALAAYNSGQGNVSKAIKRNKKKGLPTDFWSLKLPKETQAYVPKLLALSEILKEKEQKQTAWTSVKNEPYFDRVSTDVQIDLSLAADLSEQSMTEFYQLNPAFNHWATPPKGPHYLLFPINKVEIFKRNLATIPNNERIAYKRYKIKTGDSLSGIAHKFSTSVSLLQSSNQIRGNNIRAGQTLLIPVASKKRAQYSKSNQQRLLSKQNTNRKGNRVSIRVASGDSFWTLSRKHDVNLRKLASWNNMAPTDTLKIGQKLVFWTDKPVQTAYLNNQSRTRKIHYKVRSGDSFARIANKFNVSLSKIKSWNSSLSRKKYLQPGQSLTLFVDVTKQF